MPGPLKSSLHVNQLLSNVSVKYSNSEYIADKCAPKVMVTKDTDLYRVFDRDFRVPDSKRAPKGVAREFGYNFSTASYSLEQHALKDYVGVDEAENVDQMNMQVETTENLTDAIYRRRELSFSALFTASSWSLNVSLAATAVFSANTTASDPVPVFDTAASTIIANSGKTPNFGILPRAGMISCKNHVSILDRVKYTSGEVTEKMLAGLFGLPEMHVPTAVQDTAHEGVASAISGFMDDFAFVGWKASSPGLKTPSCFYEFQRSGPRVRSWKDEERNAQAIEVECKFQFKVVASLTGFLINNIN
jgi:hypothetical protein